MQDHRLLIDKKPAPDGKLQMYKTKGSMCLDLVRPNASSLVSASDCAANNVSDAVKVASLADGQPCTLIPIVQCPKILSWAQLGEHALCDTEEIRRDLRDRTCLVYGVGIADNWDFEKAMARKGCEVHAFDPTIAKPPTNEKNLPNLHFHRWGLAGSNSGNKVAGTLSGATWTDQPMLTLSAMMERLGHQEKRLSVFKVDCEGCEWASLSEVPGELWDRIDQLSLELHYGKGIMLDSEKQLRRAAMVADKLRAHGFVDWRIDHRDGYPSHRELLPALKVF